MKTSTVSHHSAVESAILIVDQKKLNEPYNYRSDALTIYKFLASTIPEGTLRQLKYYIEENVEQNIYEHEKQ